MNTKINDILAQRGGEVWSVRSDQSVRDAIRLMAQKGIGAVLVIDGGRMVGVFSERDCACKVVLEDRSPDGTLMREVMTREVMTTTRDDNVANCMAMMTEHRFRHLPVVEDARVIGIISIGDLVKAVIKEQQYTIDQLEQYIAG
ncbi:MAG: CBS domain-containing protein [bacterium]